MGLNMSIEFEAFPPGEFIRDELDARGWTQGDLAAIIGRSVAVVNQIINGKTEITLKTAQELSAAFGTSPEFWLNLENAFQLANSTVDNSPVVRRSKLFDMAPIKDLVKRHWIKPSNDIEELEANVLQFMGTKSVGEYPEIAAAARKSGYEETTNAQIAWLCRVRQLAESLPAERFSISKFESHLDELHSLTVSEKEIRKVPDVLSRMGIRFVVVEHLPRTKIDGYTLWLSKTKPVIALSLRYDRIDGFWYTLAHELSHVRHEDDAPVDVGIVGGGVGKPLNEMEERANREASEWLVDPDRIQSFIIRTQPRFSKKRIIQFANLHRIHPGIIVGQLQYRKAIEYRHNREMLVGVRDEITDVAVTDGWGHIPQI